MRLESNFADGVFTGVGSTIYKTWFNDYAPLVINLLAEPFFMFTPRTANTFALLCALLIPTLVYYSAWVFLTVLRQKLEPRAPYLFTALSMAFVLLLPLLHIALYRGMPDLLGVAFAFLTPPLVGPDEYTHLAKCYRQSSTLLGQPVADDDDMLLVRSCDAPYFKNHTGDIGIYAYKEMWNTWRCGLQR